MMGTQPFYIAAYTFRAETVCCECVMGWARDVARSRGWTEAQIEANEQLPMEYHPGDKAVRSERALTLAASLLGVDVLNLYSFDSGDFPKPVFEDQLEDDEDSGRRECCGTCGKEL